MEGCIVQYVIPHLSKVDRAPVSSIGGAHLPYLGREPVGG